MQYKRTTYRRCCFLSLLCIVMVIMGFPLSALAAEGGSCGPNLKWELTGDILTITGSGNMTNYDDDELAPWYESAAQIRSVSLPDGITSIGDMAFYGCNTLTSIWLPDSVLSIGEYAFAECTELLQVSFGDGLQEIKEGAFIRCEKLTAVNFPMSLSTIGSKAFYRCNSLQAITIPSTVTTIGAEAFAYCKELVRASVNASVEQLPNWTFYGCSSLTDVSLASTITTVGTYAFRHCENLNGIYTQSGSTDIAYEIEQSISQNDDSVRNSFVGAFGMPDTSVAIKEEGDVFTETKVTQMGDSAITVNTVIDSSTETVNKNVVIQASVEDGIGWHQVAEMAGEAISNGYAGAITVEIQLIGNTVESSELAQFAGQYVILHITTGSGVIWEIDMSRLLAEDFSGTYDFCVAISQSEEAGKKINCDNVYQMDFAGIIDFNVTIGLKIGQRYELVTFYQKDGSHYDAVDTMIIDSSNYAWFSLANIDKATDYYIALNVEGITMEDAVVPTTMFEQYELDEESHLMDEDGVTYKITGRTSRWGITGKQFAMYVAVVMIAVVLVVAIVMTTLNIIKRSKETYQLLQKEGGAGGKIDEEALRMEIMREMLGKKDSRSDNGK